MANLADPAVSGLNNFQAKHEKVDQLSLVGVRQEHFPESKFCNSFTSNNLILTITIKIVYYGIYELYSFVYHKFFCKLILENKS